MITRHRDEFTVRLMCRVLEVSPSGYYASCQRAPSWHALIDEVLMARVRSIHSEGAVCATCSNRITMMCSVVNRTTSSGLLGPPEDDRRDPGASAKRSGRGGPLTAAVSRRRDYPVHPRDSLRSLKIYGEPSIDCDVCTIDSSPQLSRRNRD